MNERVLKAWLAHAAPQTSPVVVSPVVPVVTISIDRARMCRVLGCPERIDLCPEGNGKRMCAFNQGFNLTRFSTEKIHPARCGEQVGDQCR